MNPQKIKNGIHTDISIEDYHENETHKSASDLKLSKDSLAALHYHMLGLKEEERKDYFDFGNAFELALMNKDEFEKKVAVMPTEKWIEGALKEKPELTSPTASKYYRTKKEDFIEANKDKYIIRDVGDESFDTIEKMLQGCYKDKVIQALIKNAETQTTIFWEDETTGLKLKTRPDISKGKQMVMLDVKALVKGNPQSVSRAIANNDYPLQASLQIKGVLESGFMERVDAYFWLICEKTAPFNATLYEFSPDDRKWCADDLAYEIGKVARAIDQDHFPGYSQEADNKYGILTANIPLWYRSNQS